MHRPNEYQIFFFVGGGGGGEREGQTKMIKLERDFCVQYLRKGLSRITAKNSAHTWYTAIVTLVVNSEVLLQDVSARAGDVSMGIAVFPTG